MTPPFKEYLGDSVYVEFDGYHFVLTTRNGLPTDPSNTIALEPSVLHSLNQWVERVKKYYEEERANATTGA